LHIVYSISMNNSKKNQKDSNQKIKNDSHTIVNHLEKEKILLDKDNKPSNLNYDLGHVYGSW
jgi:predicted P-loop ATPase